MSCRALQVVRYRPVVLVTQSLLHYACQQWRQPTELRVTEGVPVALICKQATVCGTRSLRGDHHAIAMPIYALIYLGQKPFFIEGDLGKQNNVRRITLLLSR